MNEHVDCPRCGYDLHGDISTWTTSCPLRGQCNECGLEFAWAGLFDPTVYMPRWNVEAPQRKRTVALSALATLAGMALPFRFWRRLRMHHPVRPGRLFVFVLMLAAIFLFAMCANNALDMWQSLRMFKMNGWTPEFSEARAIVTAAFAPLSDETAGILSQNPPTGGFAYTATTPYQLWADRWFGMWEVLTSFALVPISGAVIFVAMPVTRRTAKVRWAHIIRIAVYGLGLGLVPLAMLFAMFQAPVFAGGLWMRFGAAIGYGTLGLFLALTFGWWWAASRNYLRIPHAPAVAAVVTVVGTLLPFLAMLLVSIAQNQR